MDSRTMMAKQVRRLCKHSLAAAMASFDHTNYPLLKFWLIELAGVSAFAVWLVVALQLPQFPLFTICWNRFIRSFPSIIMSIADATNRIQPNTTSTFDLVDVSGSVFVDIWFAFAFATSLDAIAVATTFNRALVRRFHHVVSLRLMLLAYTISFCVLVWTNPDLGWISQHRVWSATTAATLYLISASILDSLKPGLVNNSAYCRFKTLQDYGEVISQFDTTWARAAFLTVVVGSAGFILTMVVPASWSGLTPIVHILFESAFLSAMRAGRTPRYIILSTPLLQATNCVHWGLRVVYSAPRLTLTPSVFLAFVLVGRFLLDLHLRTIFRFREDLIWARREVLMSTRRLLCICIAMYVMEVVGLKIITHIKLICVPLFFFLSCASFLTPAAYVVAFNRIKKVRIEK